MRSSTVLAVVASVIDLAAAAGQVPVTSAVLLGRVEDAMTRAPIGGVRILSADSTSIVLTDSLGNFDLAVAGTAPWVVYADGLGYVSERFELTGNARSSRYVLLLEPAPFALEALTVEAEVALTRLVRNLDSRRNAYPRAVRALDRSWIERFGLAGSALDLVRQAAPRLFQCSRDATRLCSRGRFLSLRNAYAEDPVFVCIDEWQSLMPMSELFTISVESIAMVEIYQQSQVRVYTTDYLLSRARRGRTMVEPIDLPIPTCS